MNNEKIGKLIKELRNKKGLTQQELGDKLGIGFRSVSKWERGLTCPDITIINELSKILGISSDELLSGKINKESKENKDKKVSSKFKIIFSIIITLIVILITSFIYYNNRTYTYSLVSDDKEYYIEGKILYNKRNMMILVNKLEFINNELYSIKIENYEYQIIVDNQVVCGYGLLPNFEIEKRKNNIENFLNSFRINYNGKPNFTRKEMLENNLIIKLGFITEDKEKINKEIVIKLITIESKKNNKILFAQHKRMSIST